LGEYHARAEHPLRERDDNGYHDQGFRHIGGSRAVAVAAASVDERNVAERGWLGAAGVPGS
jgi:hypothetical protein